MRIFVYSLLLLFVFSSWSYAELRDVIPNLVVEEPILLDEEIEITYVVTPMTVFDNLEIGFRSYGDIELSGERQFVIKELVKGQEYKVSVRAIIKSKGNSIVEVGTLEGGAWKARSMAIYFYYHEGEILHRKVSNSEFEKFIQQFINNN